jgi:hypothetical protein
MEICFFAEISSESGTLEPMRLRCRESDNHGPMMCGLARNLGVAPGKFASTEEDIPAATIARFDEAVNRAPRQVILAKSSRRSHLGGDARQRPRKHPGRKPAGLMSPIAGKQQLAYFATAEVISRRQNLFRDDRTHFATTDLAAKFSNGL